MSLTTSTGSPHLPLPLFVTPAVIVLIAIAARKKKMMEAGTWLGSGSIQCEDQWNHRKLKKRHEMLIKTGVAEGHLDYPALMALTWAELPADRRQQIFDAARAKKGR